MSSSAEEKMQREYERRASGVGPGSCERDPRPGADSACAAEAGASRPSLDRGGFDAEVLPDMTDAHLAFVPIERAETIPSRWYTDSGVAVAEREWVFAREWQCVGHVSQIPARGNLLRTCIAGEPVLVVRGADDEVRAFFNVCRHRGGPLDSKPGSPGMLQCQYHGWTYRLDGQLRGVPDFDYVELFDRKDFGLVPIELEVWEGLLFVRIESPLAGQLDPNASAGAGLVAGAGAGAGPGASPTDATLAEKLAPITQRITPWKLETKRFARHVRYEIACNWKVYVDNFLEGYHLPIVHPELATLLDYKNYVTELAPDFSLQYSPFASSETVYGSDEGRAFYYFIYPNFMMNLLPGRLQTNTVLPLGPERCEVRFDYLYDEIDADYVQEDLDYSDRVQQEDIEICEQVQERLRSRAYDRGRFSVKREQGVHHFQARLKDSFRRGRRG